MPLAAAPGFDPFDPWVIGAAFAGIAVFAAIGALSHQEERAFSASLVYLALGAAAAVVIAVTGVPWFDFADAPAVEHVTELAVTIALFTTGIRLDRALGWRAWGPVVRLLVIGMPLVIAAVALFGSLVMGLSLGAAVLLGAILAPTDPVLAGDVGVGPPGEEDEREAPFSITAEAGLNDGLAFPFVLLGIVLAGEEVSLAAWLAWDVVYAVVVGAALGALAGHVLARLIVPLRDRELLIANLDGWVALGAVLLVYGTVESFDAYGFLAVFAAGVAFRRYEREHQLNRRIHDGAELMEKFGELAVVLLLGTALTLDGLGAPGLAGWLLVPLLFVVLRPAAVAVSLTGTRLSAGERLWIGWFGVRGIGSLFYLAVAIGAGVLPEGEASVVTWTVIVAVVSSIVVHGITAAPLGRRWLGPPGVQGDGPAPSPPQREASPV